MTILAGLLGLWLLGLGLWMNDKAKTGSQAQFAEILTFFGAIILIIVGMTAAWPARARDLGQWENSDPKIKEWYQTLMQPDVPTMSCCGEADAYWADEVHVRNGKTIAVITDDRPDGPLQRPHVDPGTEIEIPPNKLKWDRSNPTGHGIVFLSRERYVWCYVQPGGV